MRTFFKTKFSLGIPLIIIPFLAACNSPKPFSAIDYSHPNLYITQPANIGSTALIDSIAKTITSTAEEDILADIWYWICDNVRYKTVEKENYRNFEELVRNGSYTGCASHSILFGTLCRAKGIPVVWVNAADDAWITDFQKLSSKITYYAGYTYLECYLHNTWKLVDAYGGLIYDDYKTNEPDLPNQRYAYAKGADPYALVLDNQYDKWKQNISGQFAKFDIKKLSPASMTGRDFLLKRFNGKYPSIGVKIQNTPARHGVVVVQVKKDFPADHAGVLPGDIITRIDSEKIIDIFQLVDIIKHKGFNSNFTIVLERDGKEQAIPAAIPGQ